MAGVSVEQGSGGQLNTELNLVPFIDLLSTLVLFLLVTAVWVQVAAISTSVDSKGQSGSAQALKTQAEIRVTSGGMQLTFPSGQDSIRLQSLDKLISVVGQGYKQKKFTSIAVSADDGVEYGRVVQVIDASKSAGVAAVALSTN